MKNVVYVINRVLFKFVDPIPYEMWYSKKPVLSHIKAWSFPTCIKRNISNKLENKSDKHLFVGYPKESLRYYFYNPLGKKVFISKHFTFLHKENLLKEESGSRIELTEIEVDQPIIFEPIIQEEPLVAQALR